MSSFLVVVPATRVYFSCDYSSVYFTFYTSLCMYILPNKPGDNFL